MVSIQLQININFQKKWYLVKMLKIKKKEVTVSAQGLIMLKMPLKVK